MSCITRCILRYGVIGGLALGGITLLVGPQRVMHGFSQVRVKAQSIVDDAMDDPMALRRQLAELADEYPDRIAEVKGEVAEVEHQMAQFERDVRVAEKVVAMTTDDLQSLKTLVARAEEAEGSQAARTVAIRFEGVRYDVEQAYNEGRRINTVRSATMDRLGHDEHQLKFLGEQKGRLADILETLEDEYNTYQAQLWQLDRQIDSIERNERLIEMTEDQQATLASYERFGKVTNLKQIEAKLAELRATQEAQLQTLERRGIARDYEKDALYELQTSDLSADPFIEIYEIEVPAPANDADEDRNPMAFAPPIEIK